ncbi:ABC transporter permease [Natrinema hispanicum]|uniref:NitT/TauT family transport system permease protein n=1 Tax=Natrinema hispanicum TaxID=392421 RepID=A0A1I0JGG3_9EURY|nr:ABC transporter permease [Natrinema hispanicum]SDD62065.1 NitT/TauT family transport system permease protein [Natrinema hispanicum]SEU09320.1 NitT/TauT family transport system permease protein [Natrinema hispanicum]
MSLGTATNGDDEVAAFEFIKDTDRLRLGRGVVGITAFLVVWWAGAQLTTPSYLLPGPVVTAVAFVELFVQTTPVALPLLGDVAIPTGLFKLGQSLLHYIPGLLLGGVGGIALGVSMGWSRRLDDYLTPIVRILRPIPPLAWVVFAILWFGIHHTGAAFIVFVGSLWINFYGAYSGVEGVSTDYTEVASSLGVETDWQMIRLVILPAAAPSVLTAFRTSIGRCWMIVVGAELFGAPGVGYEIINASNNLAVDTSVAYMLVISLVYVGMDVSFRTFERRVLAWR